MSLPKFAYCFGINRQETPLSICRTPALLPCYTLCIVVSFVAMRPEMGRL